jgi:hypothetical protein
VPNSNDSRSVEDLRLETERSRDKLTQTVQQIRDAAADLGARAAPETIKANIGDFARTRREQIMEAARENPLQAAAVGAIAAYPALALARRIPSPLMMIAAGLFFLRSETGRNLSQKATHAAGDLVDQGQRVAHDWRDRTADTLANISEKGSSIGAALRDSVSETTDAAGRYAAQKGSDIAQGIQGIQGMTNTQRGVRNASEGARDYAMGVSQTSTGAIDALADWARQNPMTAAAIGMAVGGLVASALPVTQAEARLAETTGGELRRRLGDAAAQGVTSATGIANQITELTSQEGLTPQALAEAARDFAERALKVAEAAAGAALSPADRPDDSHMNAGV